MSFASSCKVFPHTDGTLQEFFNHPEDLVFKYAIFRIMLTRIPDNMSFEEAALCEPLSVALQAVERAGGIIAGFTAVTIFGAGAVGLLIGAVAKANGAKTVTILGIFSISRTNGDIDEERLKFAELFCADNTLLLSREYFRAKGSAEAIRLKIPTAHIIFECTGSHECLHTSFYVSRPFPF